MKLLVLLCIALFTISCGTRKTDKQSESQIESQDYHVEFDRFYRDDR